MTGNVRRPGERDQGRGAEDGPEEDPGHPAAHACGGAVAERAEQGIGDQRDCCTGPGDEGEDGLLVGFAEGCRLLAEKYLERGEKCRVDAEVDEHHPGDPDGAYRPFRLDERSGPQLSRGGAMGWVRSCSG